MAIIILQKAIYVIRGGEFKAAARYSKKIKSEEKSYGLDGSNLCGAFL